MNKFETNNKLFAMSGILGRRDFLINYLIIGCISLVIFTTPIIYFLLFNPQYIAEFSQGATPKWFLFYYIIMGSVSSILLFPSIVRRVRDIFELEDSEKVNLISATCAVIFLISYTPIMNNNIGNFFSTFLLFLLILLNGKISSQKPKSEIIKFNWGAFLGTWIWGIFNKKPITLLMLPLLLTCGWFNFMLICGLKGNEWAYEKNKDKFESIKNFHKKQANQSILYIILMPILIVFTAFSLTFLGVIGLYKYSKTHPQIKTKIENLLLKQQAYSVESFYSKIEIDNGNATFYLAPQNWDSVSLQLKENIFKNAISYALQKQGKNGLLLQDFIDNIELVNGVKIRSSFNNEILAQFYIDPQILKQKTKTSTTKEIQELFITGYKYNNSPSLP